ncbi:MAG: hypothetical protein AAGA56_03890, partial [Myxococcota bacterium]
MRTNLEYSVASRLSRSRRRGGLVSFSVLFSLTVVLFGAIAWRHYQDSGERRAATLFQAGRYCLLGDRGGNPMRRLREHRVTASLEDPSTWPGRCRSVLGELRTTLDKVVVDRSRSCGGSGGCCPEDDRCRDLSRIRTEVDRAYRFAQYTIGFDPTDFVSQGAALGWTEPAPEDAPSPPVPAPLLDADAMQPLFQGNYLRLLTDPAGKAGPDLLFYELEQKYPLCQTSLRGRAACEELDWNIPVGLAGELLGRAPHAPRRLYAQGPTDDGGWRHGLFDIV